MPHFFYILCCILPTILGAASKQNTVYVEHIPNIGQISNTTKNNICTILLQKQNILGLFGKDASNVIAPSQTGIFFLPEFQMLLAKIQDKILGVAIFEAAEKKKILTLAYLAIDEEHHDKGYGTQIMKKLFQTFPHYKTTLSVETGNSKAQQFYQKFGFTNTGAAFGFSMLERHPK